MRLSANTTAWSDVMEYIPDKRLYSAVMFALKMCPTLVTAKDSKITVAANYYQVDYADVLRIVRDELWKAEKNEAKKDTKHWHTIFNPQAYDILGMGWGQDYIFICPHCGKCYSCNVHDDSTLNRLYISRCICGFFDEYQRKFTRKDCYERLMGGD